MIYEDLAVGMVEAVWKIHLCIGINLGKEDSLGKAIKLINDNFVDNNTIERSHLHEITIENMSCIKKIIKFIYM